MEVTDASCVRIGAGSCWMLSVCHLILTMRLQEANTVPFHPRLTCSDLWVGPIPHWGEEELKLETSAFVFTAKTINYYTVLYSSLKVKKKKKGGGTAMKDALSELYGSWFASV